MKLDKSYLTNKIIILATFIKRFRFVIVFAIFSSMYGYILLQVNLIDSKEPTAVQITEKTTKAPHTSIDPKLVEKITSLEEENVDIKTIFNETRKNPFTE